MNTTEQALLIILSVFLALFLLLSIVAVVQVIRLVSRLRMVAEKAEQVVTSAESVAEMLKKTAGPVSFFRFARNVAETVSQHKQNHKEK